MKDNTRNKPSLASSEIAKEKENEVIYETESFRVRKPTKEMERELKANKDKDIKVKYKDLELNLCGFNLAKNKEGKLMFGWKIKPQDRAIIFHNPKDLAEEDEKKIKEIITQLYTFANSLGFEVIDSWEFIKRVYNEKHIFDKVDKKKYRENKNGN